MYGERRIIVNHEKKTTNVVDEMSPNTDVESIAKSMDILPDWRVMIYPGEYGVAYKWGCEIIMAGKETRVVHAFFNKLVSPESFEFTPDLVNKVYDALGTRVMDTSEEIIRAHGFKDVSGLMVPAPDFLIHDLEEFLETLD